MNKSGYIDVAGETELRVLEAYRAGVAACVRAMPDSWLDSLLTGPDAVVGRPPYDCKDVERLFLAVKKRLESITDSAASPAAQQEVNCSNERCMDGWVDQAGSSPDGTEYWVDQVPCLVCGIHADPDDGAQEQEVNSGEPHKFQGPSKSMRCACGLIYSASVHHQKGR